MKLYSTLDRKVVDIQPIKDNEISIYSCGPTVYYRMHLGNIRAYINWDVMHRAFKYLGYNVNRVMNFTDVGHMSHDEDFGEDKMDKEAAKEGITAIDVANKYINTVLEDFKALNILTPSGDVISRDLDYKDVEKFGWMRATNMIPEIISLIQKAEANGYTYETDHALYFDVTKVPDYTIFTGQKLEDKKVGDREDVVVDPNKKNPADFVLWMKLVGKYANHDMHWSSPWGEGFPGWHIECSAMGNKAFGEHFDIHTGGIDHIPVHHPNERAQNIGAFGQPVVKYWIHNEWVVTKDDAKLAKSEGNADTLPEAIAQGFDPLDIRYLFASVNYHTKLQFSTEALKGAQNARRKLLSELYVKYIFSKGLQGVIIDEQKEKFVKALDNNLNMSEVFAIIFDTLRNPHYLGEDIVATILDFDKVLGLSLLEKVELMDKQQNAQREQAEITLLESFIKDLDYFRSVKDYSSADEIKMKIEDMGYEVMFTPEGTKCKIKQYTY